MSLTSTYTFEEGTSGAAIASGSNGVVSIGGTATYQAAAAVHGAMGAQIAGPGGTIGYAVSSASFQASFYGTIVTLGSGRSVIASARATSSHLARLNINAATGGFEIADAANSTQATSTSTIAAGDKFRADMRCDNTTSTSITLTVQIYLRANIEGTVPDETLTATFATASTPNRFYLGTIPTGFTHSADSVRLYDDITTWPTAFTATTTTVASTRATTWAVAAVSPPGAVVYAMSGAARADRVMITAKTTGVTSVRLGYSTDPGLGSPSYLAAQTPDTAGELHWDLTALAANTKYYYRLFDTPAGGTETAIGAICATRTRTSISSGSAIKIALGSCCLTATTQDASAFPDATAWDPHYTLHLGDAYYNGNTSNTLASQHRALWEAQIAAVPGWKAMLAAGAVDYTNSDHELNPDDADTNTVNASSFNAFYKATIPARLVDAAATPVGKYRSWVDYVAGQGIRFILLDIRNTDRTPGATADSSAKTMLGATQKAWLKNELVDSDGTATLLKVIISDVPWSGAPSLSNGIDKWWAYATERQEIADYITSNRIHVDFLHGDSHRLGVDATHNAWGGFPVICGSPWSQNGGGNETTGYWDAEFHNSGTPTSSYMRLTYDSPTPGVIRRTASGWDAMTATERVAQVNTWQSVISTRATTWATKTTTPAARSTTWRVDSGSTVTSQRSTSWNVSSPSIGVPVNNPRLTLTTPQPTLTLGAP